MRTLPVLVTVLGIAASVGAPGESFAQATEPAGNLGCWARGEHSELVERASGSGRS